ncbi:MarR family winged helix-turn-helix transcriptional regulator [Nocardioides aequoreus]|uniref:MarR family winged helix-turn-helix transcriptional regulator n=1 Tax=Nocardioides aequoreus TaxID=397278 RepID=UPI0004C2D6EB|nr:MarR family transcriptional regulator [Nocardioides aequoreus]
MDNDDAHRLSNDLVVLSGRLVREVRRGTSEVSAAGFRLLALLDEIGPSSIGTLAEVDRCTQPTMSGLVKGLVVKGWADRSPHPTDARSTVVDLTNDGRSVLADVRSRNASVMARRVAESGHSVAELSAAVRLLRDVTQPATPGVR